MICPKPNHFLNIDTNMNKLLLLLLWTNMNALGLSQYDKLLVTFRYYWNNLLTYVLLFLTNIKCMSTIRMHIVLINTGHTQINRVFRNSVQTYRGVTKLRPIEMFTISSLSQTERAVSLRSSIEFNYFESGFVAYTRFRFCRLAVSTHRTYGPVAKRYS